MQLPSTEYLLPVNEEGLKLTWFITGVHDFCWIALASMDDRLYTSKTWDVTFQRIRTTISLYFSGSALIWLVLFNLIFARSLEGAKYIINIDNMGETVFYLVEKRWSTFTFIKMCVFWGLYLACFKNETGFFKALKITLKYMQIKWCAVAIFA